ncbi:MAG: hypothetical protein ABI142_04555 [Bryocella sp.]
MKNNLVRLFVLTLAVAGFGATTITAHAKAHNLTTSTPSSQPTCLPSDPTYCGLR